MPLEWKTKKGVNCDYEVILSRMEPTRKITPEGLGVFENRHVNFDILALTSAIKFPRGISSHQQQLLTSSGVFEAASHGLLDSDSVIMAIQKATLKFLKQRPKNFVIASSISLKHFDLIRARTFENTQLRFYKDFPREIRFDDNVNLAADHGIQLIPNDYCRVVVSVFAREIHEAMESAIRSIDYFRGLWNFALNWNSGIKYSSGRTKPINPIVIGPMHTVHQPSGKPAESSYWYEQGFPHVVPPPVDLSKDWKRVKDRETYARVRIENKSNRRYVSDFLIEYARAMDSSDLNSAYVSLWRLLERLTATGENANYDVTVRRASFLWKDRPYQKQFLNYLRQFRNRVIHAGEQDQAVQDAIQPLRFYVETMLRFYVVNPFRLRNLDEFSHFFDQSNSIQDLSRDIRIRKYALRFHRST